MLLLISFCVAFFIQSYFYLFLFRKYTTAVISKNKPAFAEVSVVVCAKNEAKNLKNLLADLAKQSFPKFEIVLVDDGSVDDTLSMMQDFRQANQTAPFTVEIIQIEKNQSNGKKAALTQGILTAQHDHILLTDADCYIPGAHWISEMTGCLDSEKDIVLGYGAYEKREHSFLNKLIRFETLLTALQYFSYALAGKPYMGVGRNLAYKKNLFLKAGGFKGHSHIKSGDDDLFVSQLASASNVAINDHQEAFTVSKTHTNYKDWIKQKRRHITTADHYKPTIKLLLGMFYLSQISFYVLFLCGLFFDGPIVVFLSLFLIRQGLWYWIMRTCAHRLNEKDLIALGPLYEISIIFIQLYIFFKNMIAPPKYW